MKTKLFLFASLISAGLIFMSFQSANELTTTSSFEQVEVTNNYLDLAKTQPSDIVSKNQITNYPEPFYTVTSISYKLSVKSHVRLYVHEVRTGKAFLLFDGVQSKGTHIVKFDATSLNEGEFIAELITENYTVKKTMHKLSRLSGVTLAN